MDERYSRQVRFAGVGEAGQRRIRSARVLVLGCGALGTAIAEQLTRIGVGHLRIVDRDFVEPSNLARQSLFTEDDALRALPKAVAAAEHLGRINSEIVIEPVVAHVDPGRIEGLVADRDCCLDGSDNFAVRHLQGLRPPQLRVDLRQRPLVGAPAWGPTG